MAGTKTKKRRRERGSGHLFLRGAVWWGRITLNDERIPFSTGKRDKAEADDVLRDRLAELRLGQRAARDDARFSTLERLLIEDYEGNQRRTTGDLPRVLKPLRTFFGKMRACDIRTEDVTRYKRRRLRRGRAEATVAKELNALRRMMRLAVENKRMRVTDLPVIKVPRPKNARQGFLDPEDFEDFRERCLAPYPYLQPMARFGYAQGWRKRELTDLLWRKVHQARAGADIRIVLDADDTKENEPRVLILAPGTAGYRAIEEARAQRRPDCPYVFHRNGKPLRDFYHAWRKATAAFGRPGLHLHDFRRSAARNLTRAGVPEQVAMKVTGHKTREMFDRYDIVTEDDVREAGLRVERYVQTEPSGRVLKLDRGTMKGYSPARAARRRRR